MQIDIGEGTPHDLEKILGINTFSYFHLNEFNLRVGFENYIVKVGSHN